MSAAALTWLFDAHEFRDSDQAVAYVGLDVSVRQSGKWVGQSKLTKRGPAFVRTFLFNGANSLRKIQTLRPLFEHHEAKKYAPTQVNTIVARKLLRVAFAIATKPEAAFKRENLLPQLRG
ncbi:MAG TPA: transposase [Fimbriimonadaceae bacterium]|nr:transposase [Fimbriimonadaceae bacterium]